MTTPTLRDAAMAAKEQVAAFVKNGIADFVADNWPMRKYTLAEIEAGIREIEINLGACNALTAPEQSPADGGQATTLRDQLQQKCRAPNFYWTDGTRSLKQDVVSAIRDYGDSTPDEGESWESWFAACFDLLHARVSAIFDEHAMRIATPAAPTSGEPVATPPSAAQAEGARRELSAEQIEHLWDTHVGEPTAQCPLSAGDRLAFARAVILEGPTWDDANDAATADVLRNLLRREPTLKEITDVQKAVCSAAPAPHQQAAQAEKLAPAPQQARQPESTVETLLAQIREVGEEAARNPGKAIPVPALAAEEGRKFMRGEPSLFDQVPIGQIEGAAATMAGCASPQQAAQGGERERFEAAWAKRWKVIGPEQVGASAKELAWAAWQADSAACVAIARDAAFNEMAGKPLQQWPDGMPEVSGKCVSAADLEAKVKALCHENNKLRKANEELRPARAAQGGREGLTDEQIVEICEREGLGPRLGLAVGRAIERAHGIGITTPEGDSAASQGGGA